MLIDTHAHAYHEKYTEEQQEKVIAQAVASGVERILMPNIDGESLATMLALAAKYPTTCFPMLGLHPCDVREDYQQELNQLFEAFTQHPFVAIGEIGIDLYWQQDNLEKQIDAFHQQLQFALKHQLPVSVHVRESFPQVFEVLETYKDSSLRGVIHCFTGGREEAQKAINLNFKLGIGGVLTFKNSTLADTIKEIGMEHLILETDSPFLAPHPHRGKQNEPAYTLLIAEKLAEIKNLSLSEVASITTQNALKLFFPNES